jgi:predicted oxidoreductase
MLDALTDGNLVTNQVEISPLHLEHFENGNIDYFLKKKIKPLAWSPLEGGNILKPKDERGKRVLFVLKEIAVELDIESLDKVVYSWLLKHPVGIVPIIGSGKIELLK